MVKRMLMIAYHYPPVRGSSGVQRTLKFSRYLADYGWEPIVLSVHPRAYPRVAGLLKECCIDTPASLTSVDEIRSSLLYFLSLIGAGRAPLAREEMVANYSRRARTVELAQLLDSLCTNPKRSGESDQQVTLFPRIK